MSLEFEQQRHSRTTRVDCTATEARIGKNRKMASEFVAALGPMRDAGAAEFCGVG